MLQQQQQQHHTRLEDIHPSEELTDTEDNDEEDLGVLDDQRSIILHLLSQLKLGMDLTRVRPPPLPSLPQCPLSPPGGRSFSV